LGIPLGLTLAAGWGLGVGLWTRRGPLTTAAALTTMVVSLLVGAAVGFAMRSRWSILVTPVVFAVVFELERTGSVGPTVDAPHLSTYGVIALVVGRGFHALLALVPMMLGASLGTALARRRRAAAPSKKGWRRTGLVARRAVAALTTVGLIALTAGLARPASTAPITGPDGETLPGSIAELTRVDINGHDLSMMIRGNSTDNPVLLFLAGVPGGTELGAMRHHGRLLEQDFVVVTWDQRGAGKSHDQLEPLSTLHLDGAVSDTIAVTNYLRERFGQDRIYLGVSPGGRSWACARRSSNRTCSGRSSGSGRWSAPLPPTGSSTTTPWPGRAAAVTPPWLTR
jgi:hypothetical protein